jgi:hypothetical protein
VLGEFSQSKYMPCEECGASLAHDERERHACERERWLDYQVIQRRPELEGFELELGYYLQTPRGRFELWYAERERKR